MKLRSYKLSALRPGMRVLMRIDANVPLKDGRIERGGDLRLKRVADEIRELASCGLVVVLMAHLGRPAGSVQMELSMKPIAERLHNLIGKKVYLAPGITGASVETFVDHATSGEIILLENLRFDPGEKKDSARFAKCLAKLGDVYINNAFSVCHRKHASLHAITRYLDAYAGKALQEEVRELSKEIRSQVAFIVGGLKLETKLPVIESIAKKGGHILFGGALAVPLLASRYGVTLHHGKSALSSAELAIAHKLLVRYGDQIILPVDVRGRVNGKGDLKTIRIDKMGDDFTVLDIGPKTIEAYDAALQRMKTIVWNGPMGLVEDAKTAKGTRAVSKILAGHSARTVVGGGDTMAYLARLGDVEKYSFASTGGGAMLAFLGGERMPGLEVLL